MSTSNTNTRLPGRNHLSQYTVLSLSEINSWRGHPTVWCTVTPVKSQCEHIIIGEIAVFILALIDMIELQCSVHYTLYMPHCIVVHQGPLLVLRYGSPSHLWWMTFKLWCKGQSTIPHFDFKELAPKAGIYCDVFNGTFLLSNPAVAARNTSFWASCLWLAIYPQEYEKPSDVKRLKLADKRLNHV